jgi:hypothetical protein
LRSLKATTPGPDGMSNVYLKKLWDIIGPLLLDAWKYSIANGEMTTSHRFSILRLIPKPGKDKRELKNWRPITLSNCDHKLITKAYNNRLLNAIKTQITPTQTAYLKGRNISDNLRLVNALLGAAKNNININATVIELDAQKAFDSVNHEYIALVLQRTGLTNFIPIFKLLYKDLENDILINGQLGHRYKILNGVKQGDALSCSLFLLAIEPLIRNIERNTRIVNVRCNRLNFTWPKAVAYADDISVIVTNTNDSVKEIFTEYWKLSIASGLFLNADKTEQFNICNAQIDSLDSHDVMYGEDRYRTANLETIKLNGIFFNNDSEILAESNATYMTQKMDRHFAEWSKRSLSILGKIQIIKTFGLSQYLYSLAVVNLLPRHWKTINKLIAKFIWNKNYAGNRAPNRIKNDIIFNSCLNGGFGMLKLEELVLCIRARRFATLEEGHNHPITKLQVILGSTEHLRKNSLKDIDPTTCSSIKLIYDHNISSYQAYEVDMLPDDRLLREKFCTTRIINLIPKNRFNSREASNLRRHNIITIHDILTDRSDNRIIYINNILDICLPALRPILAKLFTIDHIDHDINLRMNSRNHYIYNTDNYKWHNIAAMSSSTTRNIIFKRNTIMHTKTCQLEIGEAQSLYKKITKIRSVALRTKILRLIHRDIFCGTKLVRAGLSEIDTCIRCFETETPEHLLIHCPYSQNVWTLLGINLNTIKDILVNDMSAAQFEIISAIIESLVFRRTLIPPQRLVEITINKYAKGLSKNKRIVDYATNMSLLHERTNAWH